MENLTSGQSILPVFVFFGAILLLVATMLGIASVLGERKQTKTTDLPYESGIIAVGNSQVRLSVDFFLIAIFFVIFDLETVFIFAWAIAFFELGWHGYLAIVVFIFILTIALIYEWKSGALNWGVKSQTARKEIV
mgnify:FL=1